MKTRTRYAVSILLFAAPLAAGCTPESTSAQGGDDAVASASLLAVAMPQSITVSGSAVHYASTEIVHSEEPTETGMIQRSSAIVELDGDLTGYVLYHPTSVFDFATGTLVNTGTQFFSGTVAGSNPVILHDDQFRFDVDLATGETVGEVRFSRGNDAPHKGGWFECELVVVGTGMTPGGDLTSDYSGTCTPRGNLR